MKEVRKEPFKDRISSYAKYLRTPSETSLKPVRLNTKNSIQLTKKNTKDTQLKRSRLGAIQSLSLEYFRNLHETFLQNVQVFRYWIQFLKLRPKLGLKEFKIRTQQLRNSILQGTEASIQTRQQLIKVSNFMKELTQEVQNNSIQFIETSYYSKLLTSQARINFLIDTLGFYIDHVATLQTYQLKQLVKKLDSIIRQVELINGKHWEKSFESILLKEQAVLVTDIKNLTREKLKDFKQIKQNYIYAESQILVNRDEIKPKTLPYSRSATRAEVLNYRDLQKDFLVKITKFIDHQTIQFNILKHKLVQSKKWLINYPTKTTQPLIPLANQLFKSGQSVQSNTNFSTNIPNKLKQFSNGNSNGEIETTNLSQTALPDWI